MIKLKAVSLSLVLLLVAISYFTVACQLRKPMQSSAVKENKFLLDGAGNSKDYQAISGSIKHFKAIIAGCYVYYNNSTGKEEDYDLWFVNDDKDSVLIYHIPVGNSDKVGHWLYHYQSLTSLMEDPLYEAFSKLIPIGRDTIKAVSYKVPEDVNLSLAEVLADPERAFEEVDFGKLELNDEVIIYVRQNPIEYTGELNFIPSALPNQGPLRKDFYTVYTHKMIWSVKYYDKDYNKNFDQIPMWIIKLKHINFNLLH
jgi:hypothetical protein